MPEETTQFIEPTQDAQEQSSKEQIEFNGIMNKDAFNVFVEDSAPGDSGTDYFIGSGSFSDNNDIVITGVGFTPKAIDFIAYSDGGASTGSISWGHSTGVGENHCMAIRIFNVGSSNPLASSSNLFFVPTSDGTTPVGVISAIGSDGFTIDVSGNTTKQIFYQYKAFK